jgi:uncharacterized protein
MANQFYALKLLPPRPTFFHDMTADERSVMQQHQVYWRKLMSDGFVVAYGPIVDPKGPYGFGIVEVADENQVKEFIANDPANWLGTYEYYPMLAVIPASKQTATNI